MGIKFVTRKLNSKKYFETIAENKYIFQRDMIKRGCSHRKKQYFASKKNHVLESPDLNIIENYWGNLRVYQRSDRERISKWKTICRY